MTAAPSWGTVTTLRAPLAVVLAFVAHHRAAGAAEVWLFFDDPADPAAAAVEGLAGVRVLRCDAAHWGGRRPATHQVRQVRNAARALAAAGVDWLCHLDADEFILPRRPVAEVLAGVPPAAPALRLAPWEALHDPALPDDILTARHFRRALRGAGEAGLRAAAFGPHADLLPQGAVSHAAGKCFFRRGVAGLVPRIHTAEVGGARLVLREAAADLPLLHFHAQDRADWMARLPFRIEAGAYRGNAALRAWFAGADAAAVAGFHDRVQTARPEVLAALAAGGALLEADLGLRARVAALAAAEGRQWPV